MEMASKTGKEEERPVRLGKFHISSLRGIDRNIWCRQPWRRTYYEKYYRYGCKFSWIVIFGYVYFAWAEDLTKRGGR